MATDKVIVNEPRMWTVIRCDLPEMTISKLAGQIGHAYVMSLAECMKMDEARAKEYMFHPGQSKISLRGKTVADLEKAEAKARELGIPCYLVRDEGRTCLEPGTITVLGIGPSTLVEAQPVIKRLQLLKDTDLPAIRNLIEAGNISGSTDHTTQAG